MEQRAEPVAEDAHGHEPEALGSGPHLGDEAAEPARGGRPVGVEAPEGVLGASAEQVEASGGGGEGDLGVQLLCECLDGVAVRGGGVEPSGLNVLAVAGEGARCVQQQDQPLGDQVGDDARAARDRAGQPALPEDAERAGGVGLDAGEADVDVELAQLAVVPVGGVLDEPARAQRLDVLPPVLGEAREEQLLVGGADEDVGVRARGAGRPERRVERRPFEGSSQLRV